LEGNIADNAIVSTCGSVNDFFVSLLNEPIIHQESQCYEHEDGSHDARIGFVAVSVGISQRRGWIGIEREEAYSALCKRHGERRDFYSNTQSQSYCSLVQVSPVEIKARSTTTDHV
jgi:hypothetical protein